MTFHRIVGYINTQLDGIEAALFCKLHEFGSPLFAFVNQAGDVLTGPSREKVRVRLTVPPKTRVGLEPAALWKALGFGPTHGLRQWPSSTSSRGKVWGIINRNDSDSNEYVGTSEFSSGSYLSVAKGLTADELSSLETCKVTLQVELIKVTLAWSSDDLQLSPSGRLPSSETSLHLLNSILKLSMDMLLLSSHELDFEKGANGTLLCPRAETLKGGTVPEAPAGAGAASAAAQTPAYPFTVEISFGPEGAKSLGLDSAASPIKIMSGVPFSPKTSVFLRPDNEPFDRELDGGDLNWAEFLEYINYQLLSACADEVSHVNAQLDRAKAKYADSIPREPRWVKRAAQSPDPAGASAQTASTEVAQPQPAVPSVDAAAEQRTREAAVAAEAQRIAQAAAAQRLAEQAAAAEAQRIAAQAAARETAGAIQEAGQQAPGAEREGREPAQQGLGAEETAAEGGGQAPVQQGPEAEGITLAEREGQRPGQQEPGAE